MLESQTVVIRVGLQLLLLILPLLFALNSRADESRKAISYDVAFDIDWTLVYPTEGHRDSQTVVLPEGDYRIADGALEAIIELHRQGHRISLFSGGPRARNHGLADYILTKIHEMGATDFSFYKILNFEDLSEGQKDLTKINKDLSRVVLVDDNPKFRMVGQEGSFYFLGRTYRFHPEFQDGLSHEFDPPSKSEWRSERNKIPSFLRTFNKAQKYFSGPQFLPSLQKLRQGSSLCRKIL